MRVAHPIRWLIGSAGPLVERLMVGTLWSVAASALNQGSSFLGGIAAARLLGQAGFGQYAIVLSTLTSISVLAQTGLGFSASKHIAEFRSTDTARVGRILGICGVLCPALAFLFTLSLAASAPLVARRMLGSTELTQPLVLGSVFVFFTTIQAYQASALSGLERYRALLSPAVVSSCLTIAGIGTGALVGGVNGAVAGLAAGAAIRWILHGRALAREVRASGISPEWREGKRELRVLYGFALPATLSGYLMIPGLWFSNALLVQQPGGYAQMAHYAAAQSVRLIALFIPQLLNSVGLSILNNVRRGSAAGAFDTVRRMNLIALTGFASAAALLLAATGQFLLPLFGPGFGEADPRVLQILLASAVVESLAMGLLQAVQSAGRMWLALGAVAVPWQLTSVASAYFLVPSYAAVGLAASYLAGICVASVATAIVLRTGVEGDAALGERHYVHT